MSPRSILLSLFAIAATAHAQETADPRLPGTIPMADQARIEDQWLRQRLDEVIPTVMRREGVDMWILIGGEYNEDPVLETMLPATWLSARRTMILVFNDRGEEEGVERFAVARYPVTDLFPTAWDREEHGGQWERLGELVAERDPQTIAVNMAEDFPLADGLSASMHRKLKAALGPMSDRLVARPELALGWLGTRIEPEIAAYPSIVRMAHAIIDQAFSEEVITPGVTTSDDVRWFLRERVNELGLNVWFHPSVNIQRAEQEAFGIESMGLANEETIMPGDFIHVDFGIVYLGLATDTQHHAYVLKPGETEAPRGLRRGLGDANKVQDILLKEFDGGLSGNDVFEVANRKAVSANLSPNIYTHAIGYHGHGAGPWIGSWDTSERIPGRGDALIHPNTAWSIELSAERAVPEWGGQKVRFMTEEDAYFDGESVRFLDGRQTEITLIPRQSR